MKRHQYTTKFKMDVLKKLAENDYNISKTASENNITRKMLRSWKANVSILSRNIRSKSSAKKIGCGRKIAYPGLEEKLYKWIVKERRINKRIINYYAIQERINLYANNDKIDYPKKQFVY